MNKSTADTLYDFLKLCRIFSLKYGRNHWDDSKIILTGGVLRDQLLGVEPKDYDIHICCKEAGDLLNWKDTFKKITETCKLLDTDNFEVLNASGSLPFSATTASFNIKFRGLILDVFVRPELDNLDHIEEIPKVPFFVMNSCYSVLKEPHSALSQISNYSYHNVESTESYITQVMFFKSCLEKQLTIHPFWKKFGLEQDKASNRVMQIHFLNRFVKMMKKGFCVADEDKEFFKTILEIVKKNICFICQSSLEEEDDETETGGVCIHITRCCHAVIHDDCLPPEERLPFLDSRKCNSCGYINIPRNRIPLSLTLNTDVFSLELEKQ